MIRLYLDDSDKILLATEAHTEGITIPQAARTVDVEGTMEDFIAAQEQAGYTDLYLEPVDTSATDKPLLPLPDKKHALIARPTPEMQRYARARQILRDTEIPEIQALIELLGIDPEAGNE